MARIPGRSREQTRQAALGAAGDAFGRLGYAGASLGTIANIAGVTPATLCHHFGDKQGLYDAATDAVYADLTQLVDIIEPSDDFNAVVGKAYDFAALHHDGIRFLLRRIMEQGGVEARVRELHMGPWIDEIARRVAAQFGTDPHRARVMSVALTHLIARFATNSATDNRLAFAARDDADARRQIVALLISTGRHLIGLPASDAENPS